MITEKIKQRIKFSLVIIAIAIVVSFAIFTVIRYEVEGEKVMPFTLGKIIVISSANVSDYTGANEETVEKEDVTDEQNVDNDLNSDGSVANSNEENPNEVITDETNSSNITSNESNSDDVNGSIENTDLSNNDNQQSEDENYIWKKKVIQTNDVYIYLDKNADYEKDEFIKNVRIENIQIMKNVNVGRIQVYMPSSLDDSVYNYSNEFLVNASLTYKGANADNKKALEVGSQGGCVCISFANVGLDIFKSNDNIQLEQGAYILQNMNILNEDLKFKVCFDLVIEVSDKSYRTSISLDMPIDDVVGKKETHLEIVDFEDIVFKRF